MKSITLQSTDQLQKTLARLESDFKEEQNHKDNEVSILVYKNLINQIKTELNSRLKPLIRL